MKQKLRIAIVGCGSAGPAAALFLARLGHQVTLFERAISLDSVGAGFMIQPTGQHVLARLGLLSVITEKGISLRGLRCETVSGRCLMDLDYADIGEGVCAIGLHRAVLLHYLATAMREESVVIRLGREVVDVADGRLMMKDGCHEGPFDLIVAADGSRSVVRSALPIRCRNRQYPWGALWHMSDQQHCGDHLFQVVDGASKMVGVLPTGSSVEGTQTLVSLFWSIHEGRIGDWKDRGLEAWKDNVASMMPRAEPLLAGITSLGELTFARYWDIRMTRFHHKNIVVIGDAAHATSPQLGQGVNLGLWDAMVLGDCISSCDSVDDALRLYGRRRKRHLAYYQWATRFLTHFFQSDSKSLGVLRDHGLSLASKIGPLRKQMVRTMAGIKCGFVRKSLPIPDTGGTRHRLE